MAYDINVKWTGKYPSLCCGKKLYGLLLLMVFL